jgi:hypothetical protein
MLARQELYHLNNTSSPFYLRYFWNGVFHLCPGSLDLIPYIHASYICVITNMWHQAQILRVDMGSHEFFYHGWPQTVILLISNPRVAKMTGKRCHAWPALCALLFFG